MRKTVSGVEQGKRNSKPREVGTRGECPRREIHRQVILEMGLSQKERPCEKRKKGNGDPQIRDCLLTKGLHNSKRHQGKQEARKNGESQIDSPPGKKGL